MFLGQDEEENKPIPTMPVAILKPIELPETQRTIYVPFNPDVFLPVPEETGAPGLPQPVTPAKAKANPLVAAGTGAVAGAAIAGPHGAVVGGLIGAFMAWMKK